MEHYNKNRRKFESNSIVKSNKIFQGLSFCKPKLTLPDIISNEVSFEVLAPWKLVFKVLQELTFVPLLQFNAATHVKYKKNSELFFKPFSMYLM